MVQILCFLEEFFGCKLNCCITRCIVTFDLHDGSASGGRSYKLIRKDCISVWNDSSCDAMKISLELGSMIGAQFGEYGIFLFV